MDDGKHDSWSGSDALRQLNGLSAEALPVRAIFLVHRVRGSGRLWMTQGVNIRSIDFAGGDIVGCSGYTSLLEGVEGARGWSLSDWANAAGETNDGGAEMAAAVAICEEVIRAEDAGDWMVNFVGADVDVDAQTSPKVDSLDALQRAIRASVSERSSREWLEGVASTGFAAFPPTDCSPDRWAIDEKSKTLLTTATNAGSVGALFVAVGAEGWGELGVLLRLGLLRAAVPDVGTSAPEADEPPAPQVAESKKPVPEQVVTEEPPDSVSSSEVPRANRASKKGPASSPQRSTTQNSGSKRPSEGAERSSRNRKESKTGRKKRRRDPRLVAIMRSPYEHPAKMEEYLREAYDVLTRMRPESLFRIKKSEDLDSEKIERRYLDSCSKYHPDRYRGASQGVQSLAEGCFTAVSDAYHKLQDEQYLSDLRIRLVEKETGKRVVTDKTRAAAKLEYAKADVLFKQKRYESAFELASRAAEGDPDRWQYQYLKWRLAYRTGAADVDVVRDEIGRLTGMTSIEKGNALYTVGEMYMRESRDDKAYELFRQTLMLDGQNVGARRRMRLKDRREQDTTERETSGLFSGLFQRKKR